jgi:hypothetical protein
VNTNEAVGDSCDVIVRFAIEEVRFRFELVELSDVF